MGRVINCERQNEGNWMKIKRGLFHCIISRITVGTTPFLNLMLLFLVFIHPGCKCSQEKRIQQGNVQREEKSGFNIERFAEDPTIQRLVYETRFSEIARRFGDTIFTQTYKLTISSGSRSIEFMSREIIEQAKNGDYHIRIENSADRLTEIYYVNKRLYVSGDGSNFFLHSDDLVEPRLRKENVYSQANSFLKTYSHFIEFIPEGEEEIDGVRFLRYRASVKKDPHKTEDSKYYNLERVDGHILLDRRSGGLVGISLNGQILYKKGESTATTKFSVESSVKRSALPLEFTAPAVVSEPKKLKIEKDLLKRLEEMEEKVDTESQEEE